MDSSGMGEKPKTNNQKQIKSNTSNEGKNTRSNVVGYLCFVVFISSSICLTLLNKAIFQFADFDYPLFLSAMHMLLTGACCQLITRWLEWVPTNDKVSNFRVYGFSLIFCVNVVAGNLSFSFANVAFVQIFRSLIPGTTMLLSYLLLHKQVSFLEILTIIPICLGVMMTVSGEISFTWIGFVITAIGTGLSSLKVVVCNMILCGEYQMHPIELLSRVSFPAFSVMALGVYLYEWDSIIESGKLFRPVVIGSVLLSSLFALFLNVTNFFTNQQTSPLAMSIGGNIKQVTTVLLSLIIFQISVNATSILGIAVTLSGACLYSLVKHHTNTKKAKET